MSGFGIRDGTLIVKKLSVQDEAGEPGAIVTYSIPALASAVSTGAIMTGYDIKQVGTADFGYGVSSFVAQPPYAANIVICANGANTGHGDADHDPFTIKGYDALGNHVQETLYIPSVSDATTSTKQAFVWINTVSQRTGTAASCGDLGVSWGRLIGLPFPINTAADIISYVLGSAGATTMPVVATNGYNTIAPSLLTESAPLTVKFKTKYDLGNPK